MGKILWFCSTPYEPSPRIRRGLYLGTIQLESLRRCPPGGRFDRTADAADRQGEQSTGDLLCARLCEGGFSGSIISLPNTESPLPASLQLPRIFCWLRKDGPARAYVRVEVRQRRGLSLFNLTKSDFLRDLPAQAISTGVLSLIVPVRNLEVLKKVEMDRPRLTMRR